jgi:hypothetical protein
MHTSSQAKRLHAASKPAAWPTPWQVVHRFNMSKFQNRRQQRNQLRLSTLIDLYIHPLYVLVSKILSSILNSPVLIHHLYHPISTLSTVRPTCYFI